MARIVASAQIGILRIAFGSINVGTSPVPLGDSLGPRKYPLTQQIDRQRNCKEQHVGHIRADSYAAEYE